MRTPFGFQSLGAKCERWHSPPTAPTVGTTGTDRQLYKVCRATKPQGCRNRSAWDWLLLFWHLQQWQDVEGLNYVDSQKQWPSVGSKNCKTSHNSAALRDNCLHLNHCCDILNRVINMTSAGGSISQMPNCPLTALCCCVLSAHMCVGKSVTSHCWCDRAGGKGTCPWPHICPASGSAKSGIQGSFPMFSQDTDTKVELQFSSL